MDKVILDVPIQLGDIGEEYKVYYYPAHGELVAAIETPAPRSLPNYSAFELDLTLPVTSLAFALTMHCNLNCSYCYNQYNKSTSILTSDLLFNAIDDLVSQPNTLDFIGLIFSGGEPLLQKKEFMDAVLYAEKKCFLLNIPLKVTLYTNGILLDDDIIDFLSNHQIHVVISLDGPKIIHDHNRTLINGTSGFVTVVRNVRKMIDIGMGHLLESRAVINDPKTSLIDVMEANFVEGFTRIQLMPAYGLKRKIMALWYLP